jgi:hypothetical protein
MRLTSLLLLLVLAACRGDGSVNDGNDDDDLDGFCEYQGDCDDDNPLIYPDAEETCNGIDDDCDGFIDVVIQEDDSVLRLWTEGETCYCGDWYPMEEVPHPLDYLCL